ncbi:MAG: FAD-dependent oxidoreductase [Deltaproteobacteria bacterium]|nr:FAD-dependent oxidoreductase [Deltaproteobacteria bacterium]MBW2138899.1 FAD-dependent oxidoreductase [Deltaproteobacteria bacterium]
MGENMTETQVVVIGGGITGTAIARELSKYKIDVSLLEREEGCGFGVTKACQGLLHGGIAHLTSRTVKYHGDVPLKDHLLRPFGLKENMQNLGREEYFSLAYVLGEEIAQPGRLVLAENREDMELVELIKQVAENLDIRGISLLDRKGVEELEPDVHPKYIGGLFDSNEAVLLPMSWAMAFAENAEQNGAHIYKDTEVKDIEEKKEYYVVKANNGSFKAQHVVNAAGLYADEIARMVGVADFEVSGWKAQMLVMENRDAIHHILCATPRPQGGRLLIPTTHESIIVAHTFDPMTHKEDRSTNEEGIARLMSWPQEFIPSISKKNVISSFAGFLTFNTRDPNDHLLEAPKRGFINAVVSAPGMGPAPAIAREVVRMLADQGLELVTRSDFNPFRNKTRRFIELPEWERSEKLRAEPGYGHLVCRCMKVSEQEVREAVRAGAKTLDEVKFRTLAGFGRCQGGFCTSRVIKIISEELGISPLEVTKKGGNSHILVAETKRCLEPGIGRLTDADARG